MAQEAVCTGTAVTQNFAPGTQLGGQWRFRATSAVPVVTTILTASNVLTATFTGLAVGTYTFDWCRMAVDTTTIHGPVVSSAGHTITADVSISVAQSLQVVINQV